MFSNMRDLIITSIKERIELQRDNYRGAFIANIRGFDIYIKDCLVIFRPLSIEDYKIDVIDNEIELKADYKEINTYLNSYDIECKSVFTSILEFESVSKAIECVTDFIIENSFKI